MQIKKGLIVLGASEKNNKDKQNLREKVESLISNSFCLSKKMILIMYSGVRI